MKMTAQGSQVARRHHHVPELLLRNFVDSSGKLHCYRRADDRFFCASTSNVFLKKDLYTKRGTDGLDHDASMETDLERQVETPVAPVVRKIVARARSGDPPALSPDERSTWDYFVCVQMRRSLEARAGLADDELVQGAIATFESRYRPLSESEMEKFDKPEARKQMVHDAWVAAIPGRVGTLPSALRSKGLQVFVLRNPRKSFVIGRQPILGPVLLGGI